MNNNKQNITKGGSLLIVISASTGASLTPIASAASYFNVILVVTPSSRKMREVQ
jgi:hypothetical protein